METIIEFLNKNKTEFDLGIINYGHFHKLPKPFKNKQVIRFKWKKDSINKLLINLKKEGITLIEHCASNYNILYDIDGTNNQMLIVYAVNSHVQLPKLLLKNFRTKEKLFYISTQSNKLLRSSAKSYNTAFGYYSLEFEEYLSNNYEKILSDLIQSLNSFTNGEVTSVTLKNLNNNINKLFLMALTRNPKYVKDINKKSIMAQLIDGGYDTEYLMITGEKMEMNFLKNFTPVPLINITNKNLVTIKSLVSNIYLKDGIACMAIMLHPKFAIALIPNDYYKTMIDEQGEQTYLQLDNEQTLKEMNKQIYSCAKKNGEDVIGIKDDLEDLLLYINT